jgi:hypothetical protein
MSEQTSVCQLGRVLPILGKSGSNGKIFKKKFGRRSAVSGISESEYRIGSACIMNRSIQNRYGCKCLRSSYSKGSRRQHWQWFSAWRAGGTCANCSAAIFPAAAIPVIAVRAIGSTFRSKEKARLFVAAVSTFLDVFRFAAGLCAVTGCNHFCWHLRAVLSAGVAASKAAKDQDEH